MGLKLACIECGFVAGHDSPDVQRSTAGKYKCLAGHLMQAFHEEPVRAAAPYLAAAVAVPVLLLLAIGIGVSLAAGRVVVPRLGVVVPIVLGVLFAVAGARRAAVAASAHGDDDLLAYYRARRREGMGMLAGGIASAAGLAAAMAVLPVA